MDPRVENGLQLPPAFVRTENDVSQGCTIEAAVFPEDSSTEALKNLAEPFRAPRDNLSRDIIRVQQRDATRSQDASGGRFSGPDTTGDSPTDHVRKGTAAPWGGRSLNHLVRTR